MHRIDRISTILIMLQSRKNVRAQDIAARYDISTRTVYRDIQSLLQSGVPIIGEAGIGYSLAEGYRLPPIMFTEKETIALLTAEKLVEKLTDSGMSGDYLSAMTKIRAILRTSDKDYLDKVENHITVLDNPYLPKREDSHPHMQVILKAIAHKQVLAFDYFAQHSQEESQREAEPIGILFTAGKWYLIAFCRLRQDYRQFRFDRLTSLRTTNTNFDLQRVSLQQYLDLLPKAAQDVHKVVVRVEKSAVKYIGDQKYYMGFISDETDGAVVTMTFLTSSLMSFARWYMMIGDSVDILEPEALKNEVKKLMKAIRLKIGE
jgi:predicted DNA-binding transcriptional regulator YafY